MSDLPLHVERLLIYIMQNQFMMRWDYQLATALSLILLPRRTQTELSDFERPTDRSERLQKIARIMRIVSTRDAE